jgi:hypothetical protein
LKVENGKRVEMKIDGKKEKGRRGKEMNERKPGEKKEQRKKY